MYRYPAAGGPPDFREHGISERDSGRVGAELGYELPTPTSTRSSMVSNRTRQDVATVDIEGSTRGLLRIGLNKDVTPARTYSRKRSFCKWLSLLYVGSDDPLY